MKVDIHYTDDTTLVLFFKKDLKPALLRRIGKTIGKDYSLSGEYFDSNDFTSFLSRVTKNEAYAIQFGKEGVACGLFSDLIKAEKMLSKP